MAPRSEPPSASPAPHRPQRPSTRRERAFVLGAIAIAAPASAVLLVLDVDRAVVGLVWTIAVAWTVLASLAAALRCGLVEGDWSAFGRCGQACLPDTRAEGFDWDTRTGQFAYMRTHEDRQRLLEDSLRNHDRSI